MSEESQTDLERSSSGHLDELPQGFAVARSEVDSLVSAIRSSAETAASHSRDIDEGRAFAATAKVEIETELASAREQLQQMRQQLESAAGAAKEIADLRAASQTAGTQTAETGAQALAALETTRAAATGATEATSRAEASRAQIEQLAAVAATKSEHIEAGRLHSDEVRAKIDTFLTQAQQSATNAEAQHQASRTTIENMTALHTTAQTTKANIDSIGDAITLLRDQSEKHMATTKRLADTAESMDASIKASESKLAQLQQTATERLKTIDDLLLGATNAGLAHAFDKRSKTFKQPEKIWQWVFIGSIGGLLGLAILEAILYGTLAKPPEYSELIRRLLLRVPFLVPLVWLAIHAARQAALAKRMEEEYAFKATISTSFEGYRRQLAEISKDLPETSPLARLCNETLRTIGSPPGQVYDKHRMDPTPGTAAGEIVLPIVDGVSKALAAKLGTLKG